MSRTYEYFILNVFSDRGIKGGNQLAVIPDAAGLTDEDMLDITREFNFSESTFVTSKDGASAEVRIFTPGKEIEYAGHPTVGTISVLAHLHNRTADDKLKQVQIKLKGGNVLGKISYKADQIDVVSFEQQPAHFRGEYEDRQRLLSILGITEIDLHDQKPFSIISVTSMKFLFVRVKDLATLKRIEPDFSALSSDEFLEQDLNVYVFTTDVGDGGTVRARFFVPLYGISEDPATGGIQSSFGLCLHRLGLLEDNTENTVVVEQGYEIGRPSKIYNIFTTRDGKLVKTETGGKCYYFSMGSFSV